MIGLSSFDFMLPGEVRQLLDQLPATVEGAALGDPEGAYQAAEILGQIVDILTPYAWGAVIVTTGYLALTGFSGGKRRGRFRRRPRGVVGKVMEVANNPWVKAGTVGAAAIFLVRFYRFRQGALAWAANAAEMKALADQGTPSQAEV